MLRNNLLIIIMAAILAAGCVGCGAKADVAPEPAAEAEEAVTEEVFKELVAELSQAGTADSFAFIDVDGDGTPELAAADSVGELRDEGNAFLFIEGNGGVTKLLSVNAGFDGAHIYVAPGKNTILETGGMMGNEFYTVYKINGMELEKIKELQAACDPETEKYTYYDGETKISDKQFADEFEKAISDLSPYTAIDSDGLNEVKITYKDSCVDYETVSTGKYMTVDELKEKL